VKPAALRVQAAIRDLGIGGAVVELPVHARTSQQAADALGVGVGRIVKSLVFLAGDRPVLVAASGANRVDEAKLGRLAGAAIRRADADTVRRVTGYAIGGVPPVGHERPLATYVDRDLLQYETVYAAAGVPECVFPLTPADLVRGTGGMVEDVAQAPAAG
jgi:prolyl-tRNA editing enzyme YbaK/EbsC (Cys-tRNA(Pro) deacylase)